MCLVPSRVQLLESLASILRFVQSARAFCDERRATGCSWSLRSSSSTTGVSSSPSKVAHGRKWPRPQGARPQMFSAGHGVRVPRSSSPPFQLLRPVSVTPTQTQAAIRRLAASAGGLTPRGVVDTGRVHELPCRRRLLPRDDSIGPDDGRRLFARY